MLVSMSPLESNANPSTFQTADRFTSLHWMVAGVGVSVGDEVGMLVGIGVGVTVGDGVEVLVGIGIGVTVGDGVEVLVGIGVGVAVGDGVGVLVGLEARLKTPLCDEGFLL